HLGKDHPKEAKEQLAAARGGIEKPITNTPECCAALIEVACTQAELTGTPEQVAQGKRFDWASKEEKLQAEVRATLGRLPMTAGEEFRDMRSLALRKLTRILAASGHLDAVETLTNALATPDELVEQLAVVGLELLDMGRRDEAENIARKAMRGAVATPNA